MDSALNRRNLYAENYKRRIDKEVIRLYTSLSHSSLPPPSQTHTKLPIFAIRNDTSAWERVKTAAKRCVCMSLEPVKQGEIGLRKRRKDLELHRPMRFPSPLPTLPSFYPQNYQLTEEISAFKHVNKGKEVHFAKLPTKTNIKSHMKALLSLKLGYSVGGSDQIGLISPRKRQSLLAQLPSHRRWQSLQG